MKFQEYRQEEWFIMHHRDNCTICGRPLIKGMNAYVGKTESNILAYVCEDCNNLLLSSHFYTNSPGGKNKVPEPQAKLWHYMDFAKFISLLEDKRLYFTRLDNFSDPYECCLGDKRNEDLWSKKQLEYRRKLFNDTAEKSWAEYRSNIANYRKCVYANCWHQSDIESEAMWNLYANNAKQGIAIQTTFERLYWSIKEHPVHTVFHYGLINYVNFKEYNTTISGENSFNIFDAPWYKRKSFEHEKEFRVLIVDTSQIKPTDWCKKVKVNLPYLIETIYVSPQSEDWFFELVMTMRSKYNLCCEVRRSELNDLPFY